jgi:class 3 adenylate cyclase
VAKLQRRNEAALVWMRALALGVLSGYALAAMRVEPVLLIPGVAIAIAALALASTELAVLLAVCALAVPITMAQPVVGLTMLVVLVASVRYLGGDGGRVFIAVGASIVGAFIGPVWAGVALAGFVFGPSDGAIAAGLACAAIELTGIALGRPAIGSVVTGGPARAIVSFAHTHASALSGTWVARAFTSLNGAALSRVLSALAHISSPAMLLAQPVLWAAGAALAGMIARRRQPKFGAAVTLAAIATGVLVPACSATALGLVLGSALPVGPVAIAAAESFVLAAGFAFAWDGLFSVQRPAEPATAPRRLSMATEDADVDELLRLIATAEDTLAAKHTSTRVVMLTDMKSFSSMTEEDGSVATAKAIQRHRDLLLPIIQRHSGSGKSTGGDGLVAAFTSPADALLSAIEMQRALAEHNAAHPDEREIWVRTGLASGEVVLDNGGRPFIGAGLNLAARVMNLADGGQVFSAADVARAAEGLGIATHSFGEFQLKNIAKPVELVEVLYAEGQTPHDPRESGSAVVDSEAPSSG